MAGAREVARLVVTIDAAGAVKGSKQAVDAFKRVKQGGNEAAGGVDKIKKSVGSMSWAPLLAGATAATVVALGIREAVGAFVEYERSMSAVKAITQASAAQMGQMTALARKLGATTQFTASNAAEAMESLGRAGFNTNQILGAMPTALNLAAAAKTDLATAATTTARAMSAFSISAENANRVADALATAANRSNTTIEELGHGMKFVGPVAHSLGISIEDTAAAMGALANAGITGSMAGTSLRRIFASLINPSKQAKAAIESLGLSLEELDPNKHSIPEIVKQLRAAGLEADKAFQIFDMRGGPAAQALVEMSDNLEDLTTQVNEGFGTAARVAKEQMDNLWGSSKELASAAQEAGIAFMTGLSQPLREVIEGFRDMFGAITPVLEAMGTLVGSLLSPLGKLLQYVAGNQRLLNAALIAFIGLKTPAMFTALVTAIQLLPTALGIAAISAGEAGVAMVAAMGPVGIALAAIGAAIALINSGLKNWAAESDAAMAKMAQTAAAGNELRGLMEKAAKDLKEGDIARAEAALETIKAAAKAAAREFADAKPNTEAWTEARDNLRALVAQQALAERQIAELTQRYKEHGQAEEEALRKKLAMRAAEAQLKAEREKIAEAGQKLAQQIKAQADAAVFGTAAMQALGGGTETAERATAAFLAVVQTGNDPLSQYGQSLVQAHMAAAELAADAERTQKAMAAQAVAVQADASAFQLLNTNIDRTPGLLKMVAAAAKELKLDEMTPDAVARDAWNEYAEASRRAAVQFAAAVQLSKEHEISLAKAAELVGLSAEHMKAFGVEAEKSDETIEDLNKQLSENFIRGLQSAVAGFVEEVLSGTGNALENFGNALKKLLIQVVSEYIAKLVIGQLFAHKQAMGQIAQQAAARKVLGADSTGSVSITGSNPGMFSGGGGASGALWAVAAMAAVVAIAKWSNDQNSKKIYGTQAGGSVSEGVFVGGWSGKLNQTGPQVLEGLKKLVDAIQQGTGALLSGINQATINIRNDKKFFEAVINGEVIGRFRTAEEAIVAAAKKMFTSGELSRAIDPAIQDVLNNFRGGSVDDLAKAIATVQGVIDKVAGLTDVEIALRNLPAQAANLASELQSVGVQMDRAREMAFQWRVSELNSIRDQITGHQRTAAEELEIRKRQAAMFNAEVTLMRAELEEKKAALEAKKALLQGDRGILWAQAEMARQNLGQRAEYARNEADLYAAQVRMGGSFLQGQAEFNKFLGGNFGTELSIRQQYAEFSQDIVDTMLANLNDSIAAIDAALANLPELIDPAEIKLGGSGGKSVADKPTASGPSRKDRIKALEEELANVADSLSSSLLGAFHDLEDWFARMTEEATALGFPLDRINELYARQREELEQQALAEVGQYTGNSFAAQAEQIRAWAEQMREVFEELGLSLELVAEAEEARYEDLVREAMAVLGIPGADLVAQYEQMADAMEFLHQAMLDGRISAEDYGAAIEQAGMAAYANMIDSLLQFTDNEEARAELEQIRFQLAIAQIMLEFELLKSLNLLTEEQIALVQGLIEAAQDANAGGGDPSDPFGVASGGDGSQGGGYYGGGGDSDLENALERLAEAIERLRDFYESLQQDERVSPLSLSDRFYRAQAEYNALLSEIAATTDPEERAALLDELPNIAQQYLDLAAQMFGVGTAGYQTIFDAVLAALQDLIGTQEPAADPWGILWEHIGGIRGGGINSFWELRNGWGGQRDMYDETGRQGTVLDGILDVLLTPPGTAGGTTAQATPGELMVAGAMDDAADTIAAAIRDAGGATTREVRSLRYEMKSGGGGMGADVFAVRRAVSGARTGGLV